MSSLTSLLKSRYFVLGSGFVLLISLAFTVGAWLGWSMTTRLYIVIGILFLSVIAVVVELVRSQRSAAKIEDSMRWQAEEQIQNSRPDKKREIEEMQTRFTNAVERLKRSKLGRGRRGAAALHALPWYLFIGPPSSGKTTAIVNSGLNFPVGTERIQGVGGTRNCDWFFSDSGIFLDTAGRYVTDTEDDKEWHSFLDMLKENRPGRPINGVLVGISVADLLDADAHEVEWHATTIRRRISELVEHLGVQFPVYLVFTKCDLIQGFVDFFRDLTEREREQVWGCTFEADEDETTSPRDRFEREFDRLGSALTDMRLSRLRRSMKRATRHRVYVFPVEFTAMKETFASFVGQLFQPNPYEAEPEFRGFYFTSGTQEGSPIDRVIRNVADRFELPAGTDLGSTPEMETKSYFLKDLFSRVVIPDQFRVEKTTRSVRTGWMKRAGVLTTAVLVFALFALGASQGFVRSELDLRRAHSVTASVAPVEWTRPGDTESLERMDALLDEVVRLSDADYSLFSRWGLSRHETVAAPARELHYAKMLPLVRHQLRTLTRRLEATSRLPVASAGEDSLRREIYADLRTYLLLTSEQPRLADDSTEQRFLHRQLQAVGAPRWNDAETAAAYTEQIGAFTRTYAERDGSPFAVDERLIETVRRRLLDFAALSPYDRLRAEGLSAVRPMPLTDLVPREHAAMFEENPEIPGLFTIAGWTTFMKDRIEAEREGASAGDWVLGKAAAAQSASSLTGDALVEQLRRDYFTDYVVAWRRLLNQVQLRAPDRLRESARTLQALGDPQTSPIIYFLAQVANQTDFARLESGGALGQAAQQATGGRADEALSRAETAHPVNEQFAWLHALRPREAVSNPTPELARALEGLQSTGRTIDGLTDDPQRAADFVATVLSDNGGELADPLSTIEDGLYRFDTGLRRQLFEKPILGAWGGLVATTQTHLNRRWREDVSRPFDTRLQRLYPFDAGAAMDASLVDVETFFAPETGTLDAFLQAELRPFYDADRGRAKTWRGTGVSFSAETTRLFAQADRLQSALFEGGVIHVAFEMRPDQPEREGDAPFVSRVRINVHGTTDTYTMGQPYWFEATWPGRPDASLSVDGRGTALPEKRYTGDWGLLRLLQDARIRSVTRTQSSVRWRFEEPGRFTITVPYDIRARRGMELFTDPSGFFRLSVPTTLN